MSADVGYTLVAAAIATLGWLASWLTLRGDRRERERHHDDDHCDCYWCTQTRDHRLERVVRDSNAVRWHR